MIRTGPVSSWSNLEQLGPIYPFVGSEAFLALVCAGFWLGWVVWQWRAELKEYEHAAKPDLDRRN